MASDLESLLHQLGVPISDGTLSDEAPPEAVDEARVEAFLRDELDVDESKWLAYLISHLTGWHDAYLRLAKVDSTYPLPSTEQLSLHIRDKLASASTAQLLADKFEIRSLISHAIDGLFDAQMLDDAVLLELYHSASLEVSQAIRQLANDNLQQLEKPTEAALTQSEQTTFSTSATHPRQTLRRLERLDELADVDEQLAIEFRLHAFVGLTVDEIASLVHKASDTIRGNIRIATVDVCREDS